MKKAKRSIGFTFNIPVSKQVKRGEGCGNVKGVHVGDIIVDGVAVLDFNSDPEISYKGILWNGNNITGLVEHFDGADELSQNIFNATMKHIRTTFTADYLEKYKDVDHFVDAIRDEGAEVKG